MVSSARYFTISASSLLLPILSRGIGFPFLLLPSSLTLLPFGVFFCLNHTTFLDVVTLCPTFSLCLQPSPCLPYATVPTMFAYFSLLSAGWTSNKTGWPLLPVFFSVPAFRIFSSFVNMYLNVRITCSLAFVTLKSSTKGDIGSWGLGWETLQSKTCETWWDA